MYVIIYFLYDALMQVLAISKQVLIWSSALILFVFSPYVMGQSLFDDNLNDLSEDDLFSMIFDALGGDDDVIALEGEAMEEETQEEEIESVLPFVVTERSPYKASVVANTLLDDVIVHISAQSFGSLATIESKKVQGFVRTHELSHDFQDANGTTFVLDHLLPEMSYVVRVDTGYETYDIAVPAYDMNTNMSKGYTFLIDALSDYDVFVRYFDTGEWNTYFMHLLLEKIGAWSPVVQARIFDSAAQKMKMLDMAGFSSLGLDYTGFSDVLGVAAGKDDAAAMSSKTHSKQEVEQQNRFGYMFEQSDDGMASDSLEVTQQVFPSSEAGKKVVVFRTNFARLGVNRATVHFSADDVYGCDRGQCDRFHYVFDAGTTKTIPIYISKNGIDIPDEVMYVEVDL